MKIKTSITSVNGGREIIRGHKLEELIKEKSFVEAIYLLIKGNLPNENETRMMNAMFTAAIDHGPGTPSALTARIVASAKNSLHTAVASGILAMGELHGSAIEGAQKFFQENADVATPSRIPLQGGGQSKLDQSSPSTSRGGLGRGYRSIEELLRDMKAKHMRVPGYGHAVLAHDHRADALFAIAKETGVFGKYCAFAEAVREQLKIINAKPLPLNIDGAMGAILADIGFDWRAAKGIFIIARVPGLVAQAYEEMIGDAGLRRLEESDVEYAGKR